MLVVFAMGWHGTITLENIIAWRDRSHLLLAEHPVLSVLVYVLIYVTVATLSLPGGLVLTLAGGLLFGTLVGGIAAIVGATIGATLVFLIARAAIADAKFGDLAGRIGWLPIAGPLEKLRRLDSLFEQMKAGFKTNAMSYLLFLRFVPAFPFWAVNLMAAILGVPLKTYVIATFFGIIPASIAFASLGAGLDSVVAAAKVEHAACLAKHGAQACRFSLMRARSLRGSWFWRSCCSASRHFCRLPTRNGEMPMAQPNERGGGLMRADAGGSAVGRAAGKGDSLPATSAGSASQELRADLCVIGAGSGGLSVAAAAAQLGVNVVLIEKHRMGGDCLNYGCVPSKALLAAARRAQQMRSSTPFGIVPTNPSIGYRSVHDHVHGVIASIAPNDSVERFTGLGVKVIKATGQFISRDTVLAGDTRVKARRFVIATGSSPLIPSIPGIDHVPYFTNETIFDNRDKLDHLVVIGGGPIGLELAQAHLRLGSRVTVIEALKALGKDEPEISEVVLKRLRAEGMEIREGALVERVSGGMHLVDVHISEGGVSSIVQGTHLLIAAGRKPNTNGLNLDAAAIKYDKRGIQVNAGLVTSNSRVFAIGDVIGGPEVHARGELSRRHRHPARAVSPAGQGE